MYNITTGRNIASKMKDARDDEAPTKKSSGAAGDMTSGREMHLV
jgi:hypothetical protein